MSKLSAIALLAVLAMTGASPVLAAAGAGCKGKMFNPISDPNWDYAFPISVAGVSFGKGSNPPLMTMPPICVCPGYFGIPAVGIGITYWNPKYIAEVARDPMCLSSLGGMKLANTFDMEASEQQPAGLAEAGTSNGNTARMQTHWYQYPLFVMLDMFASFCGNSSTGFNLAWMSEIDPTHQNDVWGAIFSPEGALFANPIAQAACAIDSVAAQVYYPLDAMFWCAGSWGSVYPFTGNAPAHSSSQASNGLLLSKFLAKQFRVGAMLSTIGPANYCNSSPSPVWYKTQFRLNQVYPTRVNGVRGPVYAGQSEFVWGLAPPANMPTKEGSNYLIWNGQQCCLTFW